MIAKYLSLALGVAILAASPVQAQSNASAADAEARLAHALEGRVAGEPVNCIPLTQSRQSTVYDRTAIVYEVGSTLYVNRPRSGAESLTRWDTQIVRPFGSQLCRTDTIRMVEPNNGMLTDIVFLGDFVPYRRAGSN